jgi:hypothetical protein
MGARSPEPKRRDTMDFLRLRSLIRDAARTAFTELRQAHPDETFYAFSLYTDDGAMTIMPAANSEEGYRRKVQSYGYTKPQDTSYVRWATAEWAYEAAGEGHFDAAHDLLNGPGRDDGEDERAFIHFLGRLIESMVGALKDLDEEGFFGAGKAREGVTLFVTISDSDLSDAVEKRSSSELNPPAVHKAFMKR